MHFHLRSATAALLLSVPITSAIAQEDTMKYKDPRFVKAIDQDVAGKHAAAMKAYEALAGDPIVGVISLRAMADCQFEHQKKFDEAFATLKRALDADPTDGITYQRRGSFYQGISMFDRALADFTKSLQLADDDEERNSALVNRGSVYLQTRRWKEAIADMDAALAIDSTDRAALLNKTSALDEVGRRDEAMVILLRLHRLDTADIVVMNNLGFQLNSAERYAEAATWFARSLAIEPDDAVLMNNLGYAELMSGDPDAALKHVQRSIAIYPANAYAHRNLGLIWKAKGEKDKACDAFEAALARGYSEQFGPDVKELHDAYCR